MRNPDVDWGGCNCPLGRQGMMCKHQVKYLKLVHRCVVVESNSFYTWRHAISLGGWYCVDAAALPCCGGVVGLVAAEKVPRKVLRAGNAYWLDVRRHVLCCRCKDTDIVRDLGASVGSAKGGHLDSLRRLLAPAAGGGAVQPAVPLAVAATVSAPPAAPYAPAAPRANVLASGLMALLAGRPQPPAAAGGGAVATAVAAIAGATAATGAVGYGAVGQHLRAASDQSHAVGASMSPQLSPCGRSILPLLGSPTAALGGKLLCPLVQPGLACPPMSPASTTRLSATLQQLDQVHVATRRAASLGLAAAEHALVLA